MSAENDPIASGVVLDGATQHQSQLEAGTLPWQPGNTSLEALVELRQLVLAIGTRRQRDRPVGMQVVDVIERQEGVQRCVD